MSLISTSPFKDHEMDKTVIIFIKLVYYACFKIFIKELIRAKIY